MWPQPIGNNDLPQAVYDECGPFRRGRAVDPLCYIMLQAFRWMDSYG